LIMPRLVTRLEHFLVVFASRVISFSSNCMQDAYDSECIVYCFPTEGGADSHSFLSTP
jgi:hypothetical protein